jgi:hypothetical protein
MNDIKAMVTVIIIAGIAAFEGLALRYGADTRPGFNESKPLN